MWGLTNSNGELMPPRVYTSGKSQEDIIAEVLKELSDNDIVTLKGGVGTGKSAIALHIIAEFGTGMIVTPTKILEDQYVDDYCGDKYRIFDGNDFLEAYAFKGKNNFTCLHHLGLKCGNKNTVCSRKLEKYENRMRVASECKYWSPVYSFIPDSINDYLPEHSWHPYMSISGERTYLKAKNPCPYFEQFLYFTRQCAMIMNLAKWEIETWIGRKPRVPIEIIDEGDEFLDRLKYRAVLSKRYFDDILKEGLVNRRKVLYLVVLFEELMGSIKNYDGYMDDEIISYLSEFVNELSGESTSGRVCDVVNKISLMLRYKEVSWVREGRGRLTVFIPRPDITLNELKNRSGKIVIMSATTHSPRVLRDIFRINDPVIVNAEDRFPGLLFIKKTGLEQNVTGKNWNQNKFRLDYWNHLDKILSIAKKPALVQVHAYKYVPEKYQHLINDMDRDIVFSTIADRGLDLADDKCRSIIIMKYPIPDISDVVLRTMEKQLGSSKFWSYIYDMSDRDLIQQCGRAVRHDNDWCEVYSLDKKAINRLRVLWKGRFSVEDISNKISGQSDLRYYG